MQTVIITIHLLVVIALVGVVLIQRSEGGGLGIGGGSGFMTARGAKNTLTRLTAILAACFFLTSIILTVMQLAPNKRGSDILRKVPGQTGNNLIDQLGGPAAPKNDSSAAPAQQGAAADKAAAGAGAAAPAAESAAKPSESQNNAPAPGAGQSQPEN